MRTNNPVPAGQAVVSGAQNMVTDQIPTGVVGRREAIVFPAQKKLTAQTVFSNGVWVIPEAVVAPPPTPLSSDPFIAVQQANARWTEKQHNLIYANPELKKLNDEIKKLEKEILIKRQELAAKLAQDPEMARVEEERKKAFEALATMRRKEAQVPPTTPQKAVPVAPFARP